ncbi:MAG: T9SS type A sorting domain-containing protein [Ginsengibacter sp.]
MKINLTLFYTTILLSFSATSQTPISAVDTTSSVAPYDSTYTVGANIYNWGVSPNNKVLYLDGFNAGTKGYVYSPSVTGNVKLRRVNNANISGNYTIEWAEAVTVGANTFNLFPEYQSHLDTFLNNHVYNKGVDNLFDNITANRNNIERLDWLATSAYSTPTPDSSGFAVFDRGNPGTHDPFCIAAITSVDVAGDPLTYGPIVRVGREDYGDPGPSLTYRVLKATYPSKLLITGASISQNRGGVFISLKDLGVTANTPIYGYSLFSNDLPGTATSADLVDVTNSTFFPLGTGAQGGIDLIAITGLSIFSTVLPVSFLTFNAVESNNIINLKWAVENETVGERYDVERSENGTTYYKISEVKSATSSGGKYSFVDNVASVVSNLLYYRIKQYQPDGGFYYSKTILIRRNNKAVSVLIFPNPAKDNLYLNIVNTVNDRAVISIFNSAGAKVITKQEQLANGNNSITVDGIGRLPSGIYQLNVKWMKPVRSITRQFSKQ